MPRLPQPGQDAGQWGDLLNEYLSQTHKPDGTLKDSIVTANTIAPAAITEANLTSGVQAKLNAPAVVSDNSVSNTSLVDNSITEAKLAPSVVTKLNTVGSSTPADGSITTVKLADANVTATKLADGSVVTAKLADNSVTSAKIVDGTITEADLSSAVVTKLNSTGSSTPVDATTSVKGVVQLAGDLAGTAATPQVAKLKGVSIANSPTAGQVLTASSTTAASWATPTGGGTGGPMPAGMTYVKYQNIDGTWTGVDANTRKAGDMFIWNMREGGSQPTVANGFVAEADLLGPLGMTPASGLGLTAASVTDLPSPVVNYPTAAKVTISTDFTAVDGVIPAGTFTTNSAFGGTDTSLTVGGTGTLVIASNQLEVNGTAVLRAAVQSGLLAAQVKITKLPTAGQLKLAIWEDTSGYRKLEARIASDGTVTIWRIENWGANINNSTVIGTKVAVGEILRIYHNNSTGISQVALSGTKIYEITGWNIPGANRVVFISGETAANAGGRIDDFIIDKDVLVP